MDWTKWGYLCKSFHTHWMPVSACFPAEIMFLILCCLLRPFWGLMCYLFQAVCHHSKAPTFWALEVIWLLGFRRRNFGHEPGSPPVQIFLFNNWSNRINDYSQIIFKRKKNYYCNWEEKLKTCHFTECFNTPLSAIEVIGETPSRI